MAITSARSFSAFVVAAVAACAVTATATPSAALDPAPGPKEPVNGCNSRDNTNPSINLLRLSPSPLDVTGGAKTLTVRTKLTDDGGPGPKSGVSSATVTLTSLLNTDHTFDISLRRAKQPFVWTGTQLFPRGIVGGDWQVVGVFITDKAGNSRILNYGDLTLPVYDRDLTVTSNEDTSAPDLLHLALKPKRVDTRKQARNIVLTAKALDVQSAGVAQVQVEAANGKGHSAFANLTPVKGVNNTLRGRMHIAQWQGSARWHLQSATVYDRAGNRQDYTRGDLASMGGDHTFRVIGRIDTAKPSISRFHISARHIDVRTKPKQVEFSIRSRDPVSGIQFGYAALEDHGSIVALIGLRPSEAGSHDTVLNGKMHFRPCHSPRGVYGVRMYAFDGANNFRMVNRGTLTVQAKDRELPRASMAFTQTANSATINFSEKVDGVSTSSVRFSSVSTPLAFLPMDTVTCYPEKNLGGTPVDCLTGDVRSAAFVPSTPFSTGSYYATINPEGTLDVTDLAGNPFHQFQLIFSV